MVLLATSKETSADDERTMVVERELQRRAEPGAKEFELSQVNVPIKLESNSTTVTQQNKLGIELNTSTQQNQIGIELNHHFCQQPTPKRVRCQDPSAARRSCLARLRLP